MAARIKELNELLKYYELNVCRFSYIYRLNDNIDLKINFYKENFCHLLGIQHIFKKDSRYLGIKGYNKIKNNELKISSLKRHNKLEYKKLEIKLKHFDEIHNMLESGKFLRFYQYRTNPQTKIVADFVIYKDNKSYILHLFLIKENNKSNEYAPVSFVVKSAKDKNPKQFIDNQEYKKVTYFEKKPNEN